jgi:hypothetical protein
MDCQNNGEGKGGDACERCYVKCVLERWMHLQKKVHLQKLTTFNFLPLFRLDCHDQSPSTGKVRQRTKAFATTSKAARE